MAVKRKKIGSAGRFGAGYGKVKYRLVSIEKKQRTRQDCPFCSGKAKRTSRAVWSCLKCNKTFAGGVFYIK